MPSHTPKERKKRTLGGASRALVDQHLAVVGAVGQIVDDGDAASPRSTSALEHRIAPVVVDHQKVDAARPAFAKGRGLISRLEHDDFALAIADSRYRRHGLRADREAVAPARLA